MTTFSHNPIPYLIWVGVPGFFLLALSAAYWMRMGEPIWLGLQ